MRKVFADTLYWVAIVKPNDSYQEPATQARQAIGACTLVTTDEVLFEFVNTFSNRGRTLREKAVQTARKLLNNPNVKVVVQSRDSFLRALDRFSKRPDKEYSLTDCSSMNVMEAEGIRDVLTNDHHFEQEGYNVLIRSAPSGG
jgi:predicted nucleic acid-binding protein